MEFRWARMDALSTEQLYEIIRVREAIFVVEQQCAFQDADGLDPMAWHLQGLVDGELAAYARVVDPGMKYPHPSIGRVIVVEKFRRLQLGRALMAEAISFTEARFPRMGIKIGAQARLQKFYESLGFQSLAQPYDEDGILHIDMVKPSPGM